MKQKTHLLAQVEISDGVGGSHSSPRSCPHSRRSSTEWPWHPRARSMASRSSPARTWKSIRSRSGVPLTRRSRSPGWSPARAASPSGSTRRTRTPTSGIRLGTTYRVYSRKLAARLSAVGCRVAKLGLLASPGGFAAGSEGGIGGASVTPPKSMGTPVHVAWGQQHVLHAGRDRENGRRPHEAGPDGLEQPDLSGHQQRHGDRDHLDDGA